MDLSILLLLPFSVEAVFPEGTLVGICLMVTSTIGAFEGVRAGFALLHFKAQWVCLLICLTAPPEFVMVLELVRTVTFDTFGTLNSA